MLKILWDRLELNVLHMLDHAIHVVSLLPGKLHACTVYSFKLLNLILSIGGHVDSAFKEMARYPDFSNNEECKRILRILKESEENIKVGKPPKTVPISLPLKAFDKAYGISKERIIFKRLPERELVTPFYPHNPKTRAPAWWEIYNGLKHDVSVNVERANLRNTHAYACILCHDTRMDLVEQYIRLRENK